MKRNVTGDVPSNGLPAKLNASKQELLSILLSRATTSQVQIVHTDPLL